MQSTRSIQQISRGNGPSVHRYYDISPEEPGGDRIVYFEFASDRIPGPGRLIVCDAEGGNLQEVADAEEAIGHVGCAGSWAGRDTISFQPKTTSPTVVRRLDGSQPDAILPGQVRSYHDRVGLGVLHGYDSPDQADRHLARQTLSLWRRETNEITPLLSVDEALALHPMHDGIDVKTTNFMNAKWSPDGSRLFVVFTDEIYRKGRSGGKGLSSTFKCVVLIDPTTREATYLGEFAHHPMWTPTGDGVLVHLLKDRDDWSRGQDLVLYSLDGAQPRVLIENFVGTHSTLSRDGTKVITDGMGHPSDDACSVLLYDVATGECEMLAHGPHTERDHRTGTHVHPIWSRDEQRVFFNHAESGQPQVYAVAV